MKKNINFNRNILTLEKKDDDIHTSISELSEDIQMILSL
jgi:hypothetical protein